MSTDAVTPVRQRMIEDMNARKLCAGTRRRRRRPIEYSSNRHHSPQRAGGVRRHLRLLVAPPFPQDDAPIHRGIRPSSIRTLNQMGGTLLTDESRVPRHSARCLPASTDH